MYVKGQNLILLVSPNLFRYQYKIDWVYSHHGIPQEERIKGIYKIPYLKGIQKIEGNVKLRNVVIFHCIIRPACILLRVRHVKCSL